MGKKANRIPAASTQRTGKTWTNSKGDRWKVSLKVVRGRAEKKKYWKKISSSFGKKMARSRVPGTPSVSAKSLPVRSTRKGRDGQRYIVVIRSSGKGWKKIDRSSVSRTGRKSPLASASLYKVGTRKRGNDGRMWIIRSAHRNGRRYRVWRRLGFGVVPVAAAAAGKAAATFAINNPKLTKKIAKKAKKMALARIGL